MECCVTRCGRIEAGRAATHSVSGHVGRVVRRACGLCWVPRATKGALRVVALCLLATLPAFPQGSVAGGPAQDGPLVEIDYETAHLKKIVNAMRITERIVVDGYLNEPAWELAVPAGDFVQKLPFPGRPSAERTEVRLLYDADNLYIGVIAFDSEPATIAVNDLELDFNFRGSDNIQIAFDSLYDHRSAFSFRTNAAGARADVQIIDGAMNHSWDAVWDVRTSINAEGWIAEFVVPFKTFRFSTAQRQVWGLNIARKLIRLNEDSFWSPLPVRYGISRTSLYGTVQGLEDISPGRNLKVTPFVTAGVTQLRPPTDPSASFTTSDDYDGGLDLKYSVTPSLTLDATYRTDFAQVEVDRQQVNLTRFSLFFPEKRDFFLENAGTFGFGAGTGFGPGNFVPFFSRRIGLSPRGTPIPIVGGTRLSGRAGRYEIGVLAMRTERAGAVPANNFLVGRMKRSLWTNSWIGALTTSRDSTIAGDFNRVYGADAHLEFYDRLSVDSHLLLSDTPGLSGQNQGRQLQVAWRDDEFTMGAGYNQLQPNFNPELGFIRRGNNTKYDGAVSWNPRIESSDVLRNLVFGTDIEYHESAATGEIETRIQSVDLGIRFENNASISVAMNETFDRLLNPFEIRRGVAIGTGDYSYLDYSARAVSNPGRRMSADVSVDWGEFWDGDRTSFRGAINMKPNYHFSVNVDYRRDQVDLPGGRFTTNLVGTQLNYAFTPRAFLNGLFQYNATTRQISSNIRFNLIHRPLSDLFLVYNDLRDTDGRSQQRAFIVKLTNLLDF